MSSAARTPDEIRQSIEANRAQLGVAVEQLRTEVARATDWRSQLAANRRNVILGAAAAGFLLGGGIGAIVGLFSSSD